MSDGIWFWCTRWGPLSLHTDILTGHSKENYRRCYQWRRHYTCDLGVRGLLQSPASNHALLYHARGDCPQVAHLPTECVPHAIIFFRLLKIPQSEPFKGNRGTIKGTCGNAEIQRSVPQNPENLHFPSSLAQSIPLALPEQQFERSHVLMGYYFFPSNDARGKTGPKEGTGPHLAWSWTTRGMYKALLITTRPCVWKKQLASVVIFFPIICQ